MEYFPGTTAVFLTLATKPARQIFPQIYVLDLSLSSSPLLSVSTSQSLIFCPEGNNAQLCILLQP